MCSRAELVEFLNRLLPLPVSVDDPSNNGLQVEGGESVAKVVFGVDACQALFHAAIDCNADFIVVHHGLSWGAGIKNFQGVVAERLRLLLANGISLYASHLPLDLNPELGHNAEIARRIGLRNTRAAFDYHGAQIGRIGELAQPLQLPQLIELVEAELGAVNSASWACGDEVIKTVGVVSGGGADALPEAAALGVDCFITGEVGHQDYHVMCEHCMNVIAAGHYVTEKPGLEALMRKVRESLSLACEFVELPTGL